MDVNKLVVECPLFRQIDPEDLAAMLKCLSAREITALRGEFIRTMSGGKPLMGVVLEGSVEMISEDYFGKKSILTVLTVGNLFGESYSCLQARNRAVAFQVREDCRVLILDYDRILHACKLVCRFHHRMIENMVELIAEKNLELIEKLEVTSRVSIREKLLTYLTRQAERTGSLTFTIPMGRTELAEYLCTDRSAMTRELTRLKKEGIIEFDKRTFTLLKHGI
ncbi:MAG: Crp/Fnr family transcriptional regulator [Ruminiclostridium sp.]|nr:Crp/Fnr family transcriptional regulator [Ruminiclostridium sp.]